MFIRAYLRASTQEQNAERAKASLIQFAEQHGQRIAAFYTENVSGATLHRPELMRLIAESGEGDIVLVEQIDRLARLKQRDWDTLKQKLAAKRLAIVSPELPTSWLALDKKDDTGFTDSIAGGQQHDARHAGSGSSQDYEDRRRRQNQGINKAEGKYQGRQPDLKRRDITSPVYCAPVIAIVKSRKSCCSRHLIASVAREQKQSGAA